MVRQAGAITDRAERTVGHDVVIRSAVRHQGEEILETDVLTIDTKGLLRDRQRSPGPRRCRRRQTRDRHAHHQHDVHQSIPYQALRPPSSPWGRAPWTALTVDELDTWMSQGESKIEAGVAKSP